MPRLIEYLRSRGVRIVRKQDSWLMRVLGKLLFFNKRFMTDYYTTVGSTIYTPVGEDNVSDAVLAHEYVHVYDARKLSLPLFSFLYTFPQCLALLSLGALAAIWWLPALWFLTALVFLAPIPAPFRAWFEIRGYRMSLLVMTEGGPPAEWMLDWASKYFVGSDYYWMWPFKGSVERALARATDVKNFSPYLGVLRTLRAR